MFQSLESFLLKQFLESLLDVFVYAFRLCVEETLDVEIQTLLRLFRRDESFDLLTDLFGDLAFRTDNHSVVVTKLGVQETRELSAQLLLVPPVELFLAFLLNLREALLVDFDFETHKNYLYEKVKISLILILAFSPSCCFDVVDTMGLI